MLPARVFKQPLQRKFMASDTSMVLLQRSVYIRCVNYFLICEHIEVLSLGCPNNSPYCTHLQNGVKLLLFTSPIALLNNPTFSGPRPDFPKVVEVEPLTNPIVPCGRTSSEAGPRAAVCRGGARGRHAQGWPGGVELRDDTIYGTESGSWKQLSHHIPRPHGLPLFGDGVRELLGRP
jgi:hypothetical protein